MSRIAKETCATAGTAAGATATIVPTSQECDESWQNFLHIQGLTKLAGDFMVDSELKACCGVIPAFSMACKLNLDERKCVSEELLSPIFNADPDAFFKTLGTRHPKLLLTKASYREGYHSKRLGEFVCFRTWGGVSPLQAAYLCGEGPFLGRQLLAYLLRDERLLVEARQQLQELLNRAAPAAAMASAATTTTAPMKQEKEFADSAEFLSPIKNLREAYQTYISRYDSLELEQRFAELDRLWGEVGECHKRLPRYVLQEFFGPIPFDPVPEFNTPPQRGVCRYSNGDVLDLGELGISGSIGLYKGSWLLCAVASPDHDGASLLDLTAINRLCELREDDLRNTIRDLQSLDSALTLINSDQTRRPAR